MRARQVSSQYEDDENLLPLAAATTVDAQLARRFGKAWELLAAVENVRDETVETGRSNEGIISIGPPRLLRVSLRREW